MSLVQVTTAALALPLEEREALVHTLIDSLPGQERDGEFDPEFLAELRRRCEEFDSGKDVGQSWEEVRASVRRELGCD